MDQQTLAAILGALDECIEKYIEDRKSRISDFIERHFSIEETIAIQKKSFPLDLLYSPLNTLWAIPYLSAKKSVETLDKMGWTKLSPGMEKVPSGIKTGYQREIERLIATELLDSEALLIELRKHPTFARLMLSKELQIDESKIQKEFIKEIEKYTASQAFIADLAGSLMTLAAGWLFFGDKNLSLLGLGNKIARKMARDKAASHFFLGEKLGSTFYGIFPPVPTRTEIYMATLVVGTLLTAFSIFTAIMSDPVRKKLGLHNKKLTTLVENLEEKLFLLLKKELKQSLRPSANDKLAS
nr:DUF6635 family protein [uncultured Bdellovibrio sp.]